MVSGMALDLKFEKTLKNSNKPFSFIPYFNGLTSKNNIENSKLKDLKIILNKNYAAEGIRLLLEGISPALIENAGKRLDFSNGPLAEADNLEIKSVISQLDSSDANVTALIGLMEKKDRKGRSNKAGFYDYDAVSYTHLTLPTILLV